MPKEVSFWGQLVRIDGRYWHTDIKKTKLRAGKHPAVGLNEKLINTAAKEGAVIVVHVLDKKVSFKMSASKWYREAEIHQEPSRFKPGTHFIIYEVDIPREAFVEVKEMKSLPISEDQLSLI